RGRRESKGCPCGAGVIFRGKVRYATGGAAAPPGGAKEKLIMSTVSHPRQARPAVLYGIDWRTYMRLLRAFAGHRRFRLTYDRGTLEIMSPLLEHDGAADLLGQFVVVLAEELNVPYRAAGSTTLRRRRRRRGLEPDRSWWFASAARMLGKARLDLRTDPPPDLAIEVDVTHSSLDRMSIYADLGVPEVWRLTSQGLTFNILERGKYQIRPTSLAFPRLSPADLTVFLSRLGQDYDLTILRQFRAWVRQHLLGGAPAQPPTP